jgi:hypothetical protein
MGERVDMDKQAVVEKWRLSAHCLPHTVMLAQTEMRHNDWDVEEHAAYLVANSSAVQSGAGVVNASENTRLSIKR